MDQEVRYIWRRQQSAVSALYIVVQSLATMFFLLVAIQELMILGCKVCPHLISQAIHTDPALCRMR